MTKSASALISHDCVSLTHDTKDHSCPKNAPPRIVDSVALKTQVVRTSRIGIVKQQDSVVKGQQLRTPFHVLSHLRGQVDQEIWVMYPANGLNQPSSKSLPLGRLYTQSSSSQGLDAAFSSGTYVSQIHRN